MITRPIMRYPGGKFKLAKWVISHFPAHETYVELYGGAASVLLRKLRSIGEVYNDIDGEVVNVFRILRDRQLAAELARLIELTPYSREEYDKACEPTLHPIEKARRLIYRTFAGQGSLTRDHSGFRGYRNSTSGVTGATEWAKYPAELILFTERLQGVCIENKSAIDLIPSLDRPNTLFYADPPYVKSTHSGSIRYRYSMSDDDHIQLSECLHRIQGLAVVSGYPSDLYDRLYADWRCVRKSHYALNAKPTIECLWLSPNIQTTLF